MNDSKPFDLDTRIFSGTVCFFRRYVKELSKDGFSEELCCSTLRNALVLRMIYDTV